MELDDATLHFPFDTGPGGTHPTEFDALRGFCPVAPVVLPSGDRAWLASRYDDILTVLGDPRFSRRPDIPGAPRLVAAYDGTMVKDMIVAMDAPEHTRIRRIVQGAFTPRRIRTWQPRVQAVADDLLDAFAASPGRTGDIYEGFALPLPIRIISELLGIPEADAASFRRWTEMGLSLTRWTREELVAAHREYIAYVATLIAERRAAPPVSDEDDADLLDALVSARDDDDRLSETELVNLVRALISAGHETTATVFSRGLYTLLTHPEQLALLRAEPERLNDAVEEILRFVPPGSGGTPRIVTTELELGGVTVRPGEGVVAPFGVANRDPARFPDPDRFDITRDPAGHIAFGHGPHHCLGVHLARLELRTAFETVLRRLPDLELAVPASELAWSEGLRVLKLQALPVRW
ncbi:cytochrome P450 [Yinghuangia seranimata]|uniref:cytochrome P450 n=1 Tax=Yinghuangia seranimata TaxID=408067 RepID=UPI00248BEDE2|nr:cytochrome P450 [Yinghuangia seranimata]MDI2125798.1 cytochrome P450 [Yinghuangia seranimata]